MTNCVGGCLLALFAAAVVVSSVPRLLKAQKWRADVWEPNGERHDERYSSNIGTSLEQVDLIPPKFGRLSLRIPRKIDGFLPGWLWQGGRQTVETAEAEETGETVQTVATALHGGYAKVDELARNFRPLNSSTFSLAGPMVLHAPMRTRTMRASIHAQRCCVHARARAGEHTHV